MLRLIQIGNSLPVSYAADLTSVFCSGQVGQLKVVGNNVVCGLSDGTAPLGIIDDSRTNSFSQPVIDEILIINSNGVDFIGGKYFTHGDSLGVLRNAGLMRSSFISDYEGLVLNPVNGVLTLLAGSELNWDSDGDHIPDSVKTIMSYVYQLSSIPGDDTVAGSGKLTMYINRGIFATDQFDTLQRYPVNALLFVNENGVFTTKQITPRHRSVGMCLAPPTSMINSLELLWF